MRSHTTYSFFFAVCLCTGLTVDSIAQDTSFPFPSFEKITTEQGLSSNNVSAILLDKKGFLWFLTGKGLNRYDGYSFKIYDYDPTDINSLTAGYFYSLEQDKNGLLWMNSESQGIYSFNPVTGKFVNYRHDPQTINSLADDLTTGLVTDKAGNIWIATFSGLDKLDPETKTFTHFKNINHVETNQGKNYVTAISIDEDDNLWMVTATPGIDYFNTKTGKLIEHFNFGSSSTPADDWQNHPYGANPGKNGNVWIGSKTNGLYCYNTRTKSIRHFIHEINNPWSISNNGVYKVFEDHLGNCWLATDANNGTIEYYDHATGKFSHRPFDGIQHLDILEDKSDKIWIATGNGLYSSNPLHKKIESFRHDAADANSISSNTVSGILGEHSGKLLIGSVGVDYFDAELKKFSKIKLLENGKNILENNIVWNIHQDSKNIIWFATIMGLISYDPITKKHHWYKHDENDSTSLSAISCTDFIEDSKGRYWVTTWGGGFDSFDPKSGKFRSFKVHEGNNSISVNSVSDIIEDSRGMLYIGSWQGGLIRFNPDNETIKIYRHRANDPTSLSNDIVQNFLQSKNGIIWFCTLGGGVNAFDPIKEKFRAFTIKDGLCSNDVAGITADDNGNYWLGTQKGLSCFTPPKNPFDPKDSFHFRNYDKGDGLPDNKMGMFGGYKDADGKMYFGSESAGLICFNPSELKDNTYVPPVYITDFRVFYKSVTVNDADSILKSPIELTKEITLSYKQNVITFEFAALNYLHPEKNLYAYKLEPFNKDWVYTDASKRFANFTNLDPGEYILKVKGSNNDGLWNPVEASLKLIITPPFWQTWWFRAVLLMAVAFAVYGFYRYRLRHILKLQNIRNKIAADLHDDIGSTLNSISVYSEVAKKDPARQTHALNMIGESSRKVIDAMSDIVWTINPENDGFEKVILRMRSLSYNLLKAKKIDFIFKADENLNDIKLSLEARRNFYLIFKEVLNNLVKYSRAGRVSISLESKSNTLTLLIRDDGVGFDIAQKYNGNGLINMKKRAIEMNGQLIIDSGADIGTSILLIFKP